MSRLKFMCISITAGLLLSACATKADPNRNLSANIADHLQLVEKLERRKSNRTSSKMKCSLAEQDNAKDYSEWLTRLVHKSALKGRSESQYEFARRLEVGDRIDIDLPRSLKFYAAAMDGSNSQSVTGGQISGDHGTQMRSGVGPSRKKCSPVEAESIEGVKRVVEKIYEAGLIPRE